MNIPHCQIAVPRSRIKAPEHKFLGPGNIEQCQIFGRRTHENQIIIFRVVQREQGAALDPNRPIEKSEDMVKFVNGQHFSHASVMVEDETPRVRCWIEVPHPGFGSSDKAPVAENYPRLLWAGQETIPESLIRLRRTLAGLHVRALHQQDHRRRQRRSEQNREKGNRDHPPAIQGRSFYLGSRPFENQGRCSLNSGLRCPQVERERVRALGNLDQNGIVRTLMRVILCQLDAQAPSLNPDCRVALGVESGRSSQNLGGNLVLLQSDARMIQGMFREVTQQFARRFRAVQAMTFNKFIYLLEALLAPEDETVSDSHIRMK